MNANKREAAAPEATRANLTSRENSLRKGGHDVPEADVRRRFLLSVRSFFTHYLSLLDEALLFHAGVRPPRLVARWTHGAATIFNPDIYERIKKQNETG
jgi:predicted ABC-type ATPase